MGHGLRVCHCHFLGGDLPHTAQVKILFPPRQRIVGAPEGEVNRPVSTLRRQRRKLLCLLRIQMIHKAVELHVPEPGRCCRPAKQLRYLVGHQNTHVDGPSPHFGKICLRRLPQRHGLPLAGARNDAGKVHKGQLRQDQVIHLVKRILRQRQIPPPVQIIQNICHNRPPFRFDEGIISACAATYKAIFVNFVQRVEKVFSPRVEQEYTVGPAGFRVLCPRKPGAQRVEKIFSSRCPYYQNL